MYENSKSIIAKYLENSLSQEERRQVDKWLAQPEYRERFKKHFLEYYQNKKYDGEKAFRSFEAEIQENAKGKMIPLRRNLGRAILKYAAVLIGLMTLGYLLWPSSSDTETYSATGTEVTLQLEDGSTITLDTTSEGDLSVQGGVYSILHKKDKLVYDKARTPSKNIVYNTLTVPLGRQFHLELSDGTIVHLNAGSKLRYPVHFPDSIVRKVFLEGEGFFSVAKRNNQRFVVHSDALSAEVFGTAFNLSSYVHEESSIVLVEGSVGAFTEGQKYTEENGTMMAPGQKASISESSGAIAVEEVETDAYTAWINGTLLFKNERFASLSKKLERHYNIVLQNNYPELDDKRFTGKFDIESITEILEVFKRTNSFHYSMEDNTITITE
ncbi:MAG: FecR domain-containing protein [Bacteroidota bacterium]